MAVSATPMNLTRAAHVGISVSDLDASIAFCQAFTGREPVASGTMRSVPFGASQGLSTAELRYATINLDNSLGVDLIEFRNPPGESARGAAGRPGSMRLCLRVDDFDAVYRRMKAAGYAFIAGEVTPEAALGTKVAYPRSPTSTTLTAATWRSSSPRVASPAEMPDRRGRDPGREDPRPTRVHMSAAVTHNRRQAIARICM
ncbi:VOC family protein [Streptomyces sp. BE147]|uniref:VOC family protein n=1 Tax=Streptomyces sp. BE147 TaxID=3002524 RepID=UPI002E799D44|nr:VOC family protein [Streptomyces sp. BE147]MEE1735906.1 VOC family protein [Streptomyces sp. BE147]